MLPVSLLLAAAASVPFTSAAPHLVSRQSNGYTYILGDTGTYAGQTTTGTCPPCADGHKVINIGNSLGNTVTFYNLAVGTTTSTVLFDYINADSGPRTALISVNGGAAQSISFPVTGNDWTSSVATNYAVQLSGFQPGNQNTLVFGGAASYWAPDLSRLATNGTAYVLASQAASMSSSQQASQMASQTASQSASLSASQSASRAASLAAYQAVSQQAYQQASLASSQSASAQAASLSASQAASQQASLSASQSAFQSASASLSASQSASFLASRSASQSASLFASQSASQSAAFAASSQAAPSYTWLEADRATLAGAAAVASCPNCADGNRVGYIGGGTGNTVTFFNVSVGTATSTVQFEYLNNDSGPRTAIITVNGTPQTVSFPAVGGGNIGTLSVQLSGFKPGSQNTVIFDGTSTTYGPDLSRIGFNTATNSQQSSLAASQLASSQAVSLAASQVASQGVSQSASLAASQTASAQAASQVASQAASQATSLAASQSASQIAASQVASSLAASQLASQTASLSGSLSASQVASSQAASQIISQQASLAAYQVASSQAVSSQAASALVASQLSSSQAASLVASQAASLATSQTASAQAASLAASRAASQLVSQTASQSASLAASQLASSQAVSQAASQQASLAAYQLASSQSASSVIASQAASAQAASQAASQVVSLAASQSASSQAASLAASQAASLAASQAASQIVSQTASQAASLAASQIASSQAVSRAASLSVSSSISLSQSISASAAAAAATVAAAKNAAVAIPSGWTSMNNAYIAEGTTGRALTGSSYSDGNNMTWSNCINFCSTGGYNLAGIEYASQCFCGYTLSNGASAANTATTTPMACSGTPYATCGGPNALTLFALQSSLSSFTDSTLQTMKTTLPSGWAAASTPCVAEGTSGRALTGSSYSSGNNMTIANCIAYCNAGGFTYAGIEYASQCFCGNTLSNGASLSTASQQCNMGCSGAPSTICGGPNALSLYYSSSNENSNSAPMQAASMGLPSGWAPAAACIQDVNGHALTGSLATTNNMTPALCAATCASEGFTMAGLEFGNQCYCGNSLANGASMSSVSTQCNTPCSGNSSQTCGGSQALMILTGSTTSPVQIQGYSMVGCVQDGSARALTGSSTSDSAMTTDMCISYCSKGGFKYAGLEYASQCYCGNSFVNGFSATSLSVNCAMPCAGNSSQTCGGPNALTLWTGTPAVTVSTSPAKINGYSYQACVAEGSSGRALTGTSSFSNSMTIEMCTSFCQSAGYQYAGIEYASQCFCGNSFSNGASLSITSNNCNMQCSGNSAEMCGGPNALTVYSGTPAAPAFPNNPTTVSGYNFVGCILDGSPRTLSAASSANSTMTIPSCVAFCKSGGYKYAGVEYSSECYCDNTLQAGRTTSSLSYQCNMPCSGDSNTICGGPNALQMYSSS